MLKRILSTGIVMSSIFAVSAQETGPDSAKNSMTATPAAFKLSGSADVYYRYNFNNTKEAPFNSFTSFTSSNNSFELGMASLKAEHSFGKGALVADLGFGRRAEDFSYNDGDGTMNKNGLTTLASVKQLFVTYAPSDKVKFTMGKWATHVGYELVDAYANRNYSMSYMFSYGPFFHAGLKADVSLGGKSALMVGIANPTDFSTTLSSSKFILGQFSTASSSGKIKAYLNYQGGRMNGTYINQGDVVITGAVSDKFSIGYNGTVQHRNPEAGDGNAWWGSALYFNVDPTPAAGFTVRTEYFSDKKNLLGLNSGIFAGTLSGNFTVGNLKVIPELRLENASRNMYIKNDGTGTKSTASFILAAVYGF